jgi:UDP-N-acetylmuramate dehydrogenase
VPLAEPVARALDAADLPWAADVILAERVWWRAGGPADALVTASTVDQLSRLQAIAAEHGVDVWPLGAGSNVLVSDRGVRGVVVELAGELADTAEQDGALVAGGGLKLTVLLARAKKHRWPGLEALAGIPGTVGGAVRMNAGTSLGEIADRLLRAELVLRGGEVVTRDRADLGLRYRHSALPPGAVVSRAWLRLDGDFDASLERMTTFLARRKATQPLDKPSCGSTFANPPGDTAGRLIEAAGLKGFRVGDAEVSEKHANFVLNVGRATAADILAVLRHVEATVLDRFGVRLEREVQLVGTWDEG